MIKRSDNYLGNNKHLPEVKSLLRGYVHLDQTNDFIGSQFETPKGGTLTVVGYNKEIQTSKARKYTCHCNLCLQDYELWKEDSILCAKDKLLSGRIPCGCSAHKLWSSSQYEVINKRNAEKLNYKIIGYESYPVKSSTPIIVTCNNCFTQDSELWGGITFTTDCHRLKKGVLNCGCESSYEWTEQQNKIRIKRLCEKLGYIFHGWAEVYKKNITHLDVENPATGNRWQSTTINNFLRGNYDPLEGSERTRISSLKTEDWWVEQFMSTGKIQEGSSFTRLKEKNKRGYMPFWKFTCSKCSEDMYAKAGLCTGTFKTTGDSLKVGKLPCRCSSGYRWPKEQCELRIKTVCEKENLKFIGLSEKYIGAKTKFKWYCQEGHECETTVNGFLGGTRCPICCPTGFDVSKPAYFYIVKWVGFGESYIKYGITNKAVIKRVKDQYRKSLLDYSILNTYRTDIGQYALDVENSIKDFYGREGVCPKNWLPDGYTETVEDTSENLDMLLSILTESPLTLVEDNTKG